MKDLGTARKIILLIERRRRKFKPKKRMHNGSHRYHLVCIPYGTTVRYAAVQRGASYNAQVTSTVDKTIKQEKCSINTLHYANMLAVTPQQK